MKLIVDRNKLIALMNSTFEGHAYRMGAKPKLGSPPNSWKLSDCSGYARYILYGCALIPGKPPVPVELPAGSVQQREWLVAHGWSPCEYAETEFADSVLRIAFIQPIPGRAGHVWLVINGRTIESYGGHGPGRRRWDTAVLKREVFRCYALTDKLP